MVNEETRVSISQIFAIIVHVLPQKYAATLQYSNINGTAYCVLFDKQSPLVIYLPTKCVVLHLLLKFKTYFNVLNQLCELETNVWPEISDKSLNPHTFNIYQMLPPKKRYYASITYSCWDFL